LGLNIVLDGRPALTFPITALPAINADAARTGGIKVLKSYGGGTVSATGLRVKASIRMEPEHTPPAVKPLAAGWGVTVAYGGKLFPGRVLACEKPIAWGQVGEAVIDVIASERHDVDMQVGSVFELRDGFTKLIATATVLSLIDES